jgi:hypothetical protein
MINNKQPPSNYLLIKIRISIRIIIRISIRIIIRISIRIRILSIKLILGLWKQKNCLLFTLGAEHKKVHN